MSAIGPWLAAGVGVGVVTASNYVEDLKKYIQSAWGSGLAVTTGDMSQQQVVRMVNRQLDLAMAQVRDLARQEARASRSGWQIRQGVPWPRISPLLLLKLLCVAGVALGVLRLLGFGLADIYLVPKRSIARQLEALEQTVKEVQDQVEHQFKELMGTIGTYRDEISSTQEEMQEAIGTMDVEVVNVRDHVSVISESTGRMERKVVGTTRGIQLLCQVVADNFPQTVAQQKLRGFAQDSIRAAEELERVVRPSLASRLLGRLTGSAPAAAPTPPDS